ncbi:MAG: hypothetical protein LBI03_00540 [Clostridiales bacterium]|jgi:hypothetical protein|nr:hypothetical protein [Clostridiales bacterium]
MKISYTFATNETIEIETSEEWAYFINNLDRLDYNNSQRETRRHCSLDALNLDNELFPSCENIAAEVERNELNTSVDMPSIYFYHHNKHLFVRYFLILYQHLKLPGWKA